MRDEELAGQWRDVAGADLRACEQCGRPLEAAALRPAESHTAYAEVADRLRVCPSCWEALERGAEPIIPDDDDEEDEGLQD